MKLPTWKATKIALNHPREAKAVRVVADGAIRAPGQAEGRLVPVVIVDTRERPDVDEYVRVHQHSQGGGDVVTQWGKQRFGKWIWLHIRVVRPVELNIFVRFDPEENAHLINLILRAEAMYLQPGSPGERLRDTINRPMIILGVPDTGFGKDWAAEYIKIITRRFRKKGLKGAAAAAAAADHIRAMNLLADSIGTFEPKVGHL